MEENRKFDAISGEKDPQERCQRCGEPEGGDLRTLWMSCLYAMEELGLPFTQEVLFNGKAEDMEMVKEGTKIDVGDGRKITLGGPTLKCNGELTPRGFYTLKVCKRCRAEWMDTIQSWFTSEIPEVSYGSGIFIRHNGTNVEVTEEEYYQWKRSQGIPEDQIPPPTRIVS